MKGEEEGWGKFVADPRRSTLISQPNLISEMLLI